MAPAHRDRINYILASHAVENLKPSKTAMNLLARMADGEISADRAVSAILKQYGVSPVKPHG